MLSFMQINTNRSEASMDLAAALASKKGIEYLLVSEPNVRVVNGRKWYKGNLSDAAIGFLGKNTEISKTGGGNGFVWIVIRGYTVYSCYISPNVSLETFETFLEELGEDLRRRGSRRTILTGDFNAKSPYWGATLEDNRGSRLAELLISLGFVTLNHDGVYTFTRNDSGSTIDVTAITEDLIEVAANWSVLEEEESLSPHRYITFEVTSERPRRESWTYGPINPVRLRTYLEQAEDQLAEKTPDRLGEVLGTAYRQTTGKIRTTQGCMPYWWTEDIATLRKDTVGSRRKVTRARAAGRDPEIIARLSADYKAAKKTLRQAINKSKKRCWKALLTDLEDDLFGEGYKIVTRSLNIPYPPLKLTRDDTQRQIDKLFPAAPPREWEMEPLGNILPFHIEELIEAAKKLKCKKSPGPDGIPAEAVKAAVTIIGQYILEVMNGQLRNGTFPKIWKVSRVVLIPKPVKTPGQEITYRPICLVNTCAKLYEQLIKTRLEREIEEKGSLAVNQFGFRRGRSTINAVQTVLDHARNAHRGAPSEWCTLVAVDVRNAFNTADWGVIIDALEIKGISAYLTNVIKSYLSDRVVTVARGVPPRQVNVGVPQGSILGPLLWNVMYDAILSIDLPTGVSIIGYADDIALIGRDRSWDRLERKMEEALGRVDNWLTNHNLTMAPEKTEAIALKFGRRAKEWVVTLRGQPINLSANIKYLGVMLDNSVCFGPHIRMAAGKAEASAKALAKLMPNIGGPSEKKRRILCAAVHSILLYGAPVWSQAMGVASYRQRYHSVQRKLGLRVCRAYRTTSYDATMVLASLIPIHLLADEQRRIWLSETPRKEAKTAERETTIDKWQEEWTHGSKGAWTRKLIPHIRPWLTRKHGEVSYQLSQALTGHGSFRSYTYRIRKTPDDRCQRCGVEDTAQHTVFVCPVYERIRRETWEQTGDEITPENVITKMLASENSWKAIEAAIAKIMDDKAARESESDIDE